jgi:hypothetical protein
MNEELRADEYVEEIDNFSRGKLNCKEDLKILLKHIFSYSNEEQLNELSFTAKYVQGLFRAINQGSANPEIKNIDDLKKEITQNIEKCVSILKEVIPEEECNAYWNERYFELNTKSFFSLKYLLSDLEWVKMYRNDAKRTKINQ